MREFFGSQVDDATHVSPPVHDAKLRQAFSFLRPKPSVHRLVRIGGAADGAYLLPDDLEGIAACFSPGVNNFKTFEDELCNSYKIPSHMCDYSSDVAKLRTPLIEGMQTFQKKWLDVEHRPDSISMSDWVAEFSPHGIDLMLQMDIEGAEYRNILNCPDEILGRFRIIVIELHGLQYLNDPAVLNSVLAPFFEKLDRLFLCVHAHPNNCAALVDVADGRFSISPVLEITLHRKDRQEVLFNGIKFDPELPHPLDIDSNVPALPPIFLGDEWRVGRQSFASRIRQLEIELAYSRLNAAEHKLAAERAAVSSKLQLLLSLLRKPKSLEVFPASALDSRAQQNVALGCPFSVSSAYPGTPVSGTNWGKAPFFFHTAFQVGPRITLDLLTNHFIFRVKVENRTDCCWSRSNGLFAVLHSDASPESGGSFVFPLSESFLNGRELAANLELNGEPARYVTLITPLYSALHFSNVSVFGFAT